MADDFALLFNAITPQRPTRFERIAIPAKRVAAQDQVDARLLLPDMRHFMDEQPLLIDVAITEIAAIKIALWVKPDVAIGRHRHAARLEKRPFAVVDADVVILDGVAEH